MTPIMQTRFGFPGKAPIEEWGNCGEACLASLLDLPLSAIPDINDTAYREFGAVDVHWGTVFKRFIESQGYSWWRMNWETAYTWAPQFLSVGQLAITAGPSPRSPDGTDRHGVICRWTGDRWDLVHDPHPSGEGVLAVYDVDILVPLLPTRPAHT